MVISTVFISAVQSRALIAKLAGNLRVDEKAFVTKAALREELAFLLRMDILTLRIRLVTLRPMLTSNL